MQIIEAPSPNFNERKLPVSLIILHYTGMENGPVALERMRDPEAQVSAHYMVEEDGRVFRLVADEKRAWHAGVSSWLGESDLNSASIGIEIVNGGHDFGLPAYPDVQIEAVIALLGDLMSRWSIPANRVIGHSDIAPGRKQDPGEHFPWARLVAAGCAAALDAVDPMPGEAEDLLKQAGYGGDASLREVIAAFQRRWRPSKVDGLLDEETRDLIARAAGAA
ncbi:MAG: N-acetylmuramoyl-L-alanine amidase [Alphaproteobacteria bacterium]|nr:N-acetylmuramoyl-L-alanine amidase [Alphaproteobacteria bacterium]